MRFYESNIIMLISNVEVKKLPEPYRTIVPLIGIENTLNLAKKFQGTNVYFTKLDTFVKQMRNQKIREEFNGDNLKQLAQKYNLSETWVREILLEPPKK